MNFEEFGDIGLRDEAQAYLMIGLTCFERLDHFLGGIENKSVVTWYFSPNEAKGLIADMGKFACAADVFTKEGEVMGLFFIFSPVKLLYCTFVKRVC